MTTEVGSGQVAIFPTFKGFRKAVGDQTDGAAKSSATGFGKIFQNATRAVGRSSGLGFANTFNSSVGTIGVAASRQLQAQVTSATRALSAARLKDQDAAGKVRVAEAALTEARVKGVSGSALVVAAEERLASAQRAQVASQAAVVESTSRLKAAQESLANSTIASNDRISSSSRSTFGGIGRLFKPLSAVFAGFIGFQLVETGVRKLTSVVQSSLSTMAEWAVLNAQSAAFVKSTGGVAGVTAKQVHSLSQQIEELTGTSIEQVQAGANIVGTFKNIRNEAGKGNDIFNQTTLAAVNMARALGKDVPTSALQLGKALNNPITGLAKLQRAGVSFTAQQVDEVKALVKTGQTLQAQKLILAEVNSEFGASGAEFRNTIPGALTVFQGAIAAAGVKLTQSLSPAIVNVLDLGTELIDKFKDSSFATALTTNIDTWVSGLKGRIETVVGLVGKVSSSGKGLSLPGLVGADPSLVQLSPLFDFVAQIGPTLKKNLPDIKQFASNIALAVKELIPLLPPLTKLLLALQGLGESLKIFKVLTGAVSLLVNLSLGPTVNAIQDIVDVLSGKSSFGNFESQVMDIGGAMGFLQGAVVSLLTPLFGVSHNIAQFVLDAMHNFDLFKTSLVNAFVGARNYLVGVGDQITSALHGAETWLVDAGRKIIGGLITGIRSELGDLGKFLGTIGNFIVQHKGPPSADAVLLNDNGSLIMQGLIAGIASKKADLAKMLAGVQTSLVAATPGTAAGGPASAAAGGISVHQHFAPVPEQDARITARNAGREFARAIAGSI